METVNDRFKNKYEDFYNKFCYLEDGKASERVINAVFRYKGRNNE
ncbi:CDP-glycerol glycerophosphotransferase family protein [Staphylococcus xylosus]|nr:CDP-glycerol glycerophosphotransferase family protein [Staphylococcus xylosus]